MTAGFRSDGRCHLNLNADGSRITHLSAHVDEGTVMRAVEYPAESRVVLDLGSRLSGSVSVFLRAAELARLIDLLNAAYTRVARRPEQQRRRPAGSVGAQPAGRLSPTPATSSETGMSLSRRDVRRLRSAGWEVIDVGPAVRVRRVLWWLVTGHKPTPDVSVVRSPRRSR